MKQAINILLKLDKKTDKIRRKYDPYSDKFKPHITLVYPFEFKDQKALIGHIENAIKCVKPFKISLEKIGESFPFVQLIAKEGKKELLLLRKKLNGKILRDLGEKEPLKYPPHMTIGIIENKGDFKRKVKEIKMLKPYYKSTIRSIQLITLDKNMVIKSKRSFRLI